MRRHSSQNAIALGALLCLWLAFCLPGRAAVLLDVQQVETPGALIGGVHLRLDTDADGHLHMDLKVERVDLDAVGWRKVGLAMDGSVTRAGGGRWLFDGKVALNGAPGGLLGDGKVKAVLDVGANNLSIDVAQKTTRINAALPMDQLSHARVKLDNLPLRWLDGILAKAWNGRVKSGRLSGTLALDVGDGGLRSSGDLRLAKAGFDANGGKLAARDLSARGRLTLDTIEGTVNTDLNLRGGQLLLGSFYADLPSGHDVHLAVDAHSGAGGTDLRMLRVTDPQALQLSGSMLIGNDGSIRQLNLGDVRATLPAAYQRYGKAWLATLGFPDLHAAGHLVASVRSDARGLRAFRFQASDVDLAGGGRLGVTGLNGGLDWRRGENRPATGMSWRGLRFYDIAFGAADGRWQSRDGRLTMLAPLDIGVLGGQLHLQTLAWNPAAADKQHLRTALTVTDVDVTRLSEALGWPRFPGTLAGSVPGLRYSGDHVELDGGLSLHVFGGFVDVTRLALQHPFGDTPALAGDVSLRQLDLAALTSVFDFGRITGRLNGDVGNLRMVDWKPVAFKARLLTDGKGRISQRAVKNLTSVGGGGIAAGLQGTVMKLFDSFGYKRIGLSCTLQGSVCHMDGLEPADDGYLIVQGRGLPHLSVIGHQHEVSWPTLVSRLKAAIEGDGPVVQ